MSNCLMFILREDLKERAVWEGKVRANCGTCAQWDWDAEKCRQEILLLPVKTRIRSYSKNGGDLSGD